jgi:TRAP-type C4-dicarboxylate transport system substrate-binding protein
MKNLKIRTTSSAVMINTFESLGANTVVLAPTDLYSGLQTGVADGQENAYNAILLFKLQEIQKYLTETNHVMGYFIPVANDEWFSSLPEDIQSAISQAVKEACAWQRAELRKSIESDRQTCIDAGMEITQVDLAEFQQAVQPVYDEFLAKYPDSEAIVEEIRNLGENY